MKTPKQRFQETDHAKAFYDLVVSPPMLAALEYAMLEMVDSEMGVGDERQAMASAFRIDGAKRFARILTELPVVTEQPKRAHMPVNLQP